MTKYFQIFWFLMILKAFSGILLIISYLTGIELLYLFKIPLLGSVMIIFLFHLEFKIFNGFISKLFLFGLFLTSIVAVYFGNSLSTKTLSHLYTFSIAIFGVSFGHSFAKNYTKKIDDLVNKYIDYLFWVSTGIMLIYYYCYYIAGTISYFGFDSELPLVVAFFLGMGRNFYAVVSLLLIFFSGKRSPLISSMVLVIMLSLRNFKITKPKNLAIAIILTAVVSLGIMYAYSRDFLWRYENVLSVDLSDEDSFYIATSGRSAEFMGVLNHMNAAPERWWIGSGLGGSYYIDIIRGDYEQRYQHYTHLSLLSFVFLFGVPFTILLVGYILNLIIKNYKYIKNKYYMALVITFIGATFGASMFVDPIFWVLLGINSYMAYAEKDSFIVNYKVN